MNTKAVQAILAAVKPLGKNEGIEMLAGLLASLSGESCHVFGETTTGASFVVKVEVNQRTGMGALS